MIMDEKQKVKDLLVATRFGVSALEMETIINVNRDIALAVIAELKAEGEDIQTFGEDQNPAELVLYSIGAIEEGI
ncbi:hypothetical protein BIZ37_00745 [Photobacterium sp. BZF1]|nr:hypothetical protein [Photobacterium sp. BZF1]